MPLTTNYTYREALFLFAEVTEIIDNKVKLTTASGDDDANTCNLTARGRKGTQVPTVKSSLEASD